MRSLRKHLELACRVGAFALLGWLLGAALFPSTSARTERATSSDLQRRLPAWTRMPAAVSLHADLARVPDQWLVDWLHALRASGHRVTWSGAPQPLAVSAEAVADPAGGVRIDVAAPAGSVVVGDESGVIDTLRVSGAGGSIVVPLADGRVQVSAASEGAGADADNIAPPRAVLVVARAGWEGKFVATALEERGWRVLTRFAVAPGVDVSDGVPSALDTARIAAVIALDSTVERLPAIDAYVRSGGGLILAGAAAGASNVMRLAAGSVAPRTRPALTRVDSIGLGTTGFYPVSSLSTDAVQLVRRPGGISIAARRVGAGRVLQVGFDDTWRWRMAGGSSSVEAHRLLWSRLVSSVAYAGAGPASPSSAGSAPLAALTQRLGGPVAMSQAATVWHADNRVLLTVMIILLLVEWYSRRMRGLK